MKKYKHLPILGIGPVYVISILLLTLVAVILRNLPVFKSGSLQFLHIPLVIIGIFFVILSAFIWIQAVIISKLDENIKKNHLVTSGVYAWVRSNLFCFYDSMHRRTSYCRQCVVLCTSFSLLVAIDCAYEEYRGKMAVRYVW